MDAHKIELRKLLSGDGGDFPDHQCRAALVLVANALNTMVEAGVVGKNVVFMAIDSVREHAAEKHGDTDFLRAAADDAKAMVE